MSTVEVHIDDEVLKLPSRFYHLIAKLQTVMQEFTLELKVGKIRCFFESEYVEIDEESEEAVPDGKSGTVPDRKAETPENSETDIEELLHINIEIDKQAYEFSGEEFWEQFLSVKTVESKNAKKFSRFRFKDNSSGIMVKRVVDKNTKKEVTTLEVYGYDEKVPLLSMNVSDLKAITAKGFPVKLGTPLVTALTYL